MVKVLKTFNNFAIEIMLPIFTIRMKIICRFTIVLLLFAAMQGKASVMRSTTNVDGLSNSAILSMCSASDGLLWIGTCDGVNISDGNAVYQPKKLFPNISFSGNIVENMLEDKSGNMWIQTNYGLDCINITTGRNFQFPDYAGREKLRLGEGKDLFIYNEHGVLSYLTGGETPTFKEIGKLDFAMPSVLEMTIDSSGVTFYTFDGVSHCDMLKQSDGSFRLGKVTKTDSTRLIFAKIDGDDVLSVGEDCNVRLHSPGKPAEILVNIAGTVYAHGDISDIMRDRVGNLFVSFRTDGAVKCIRDNEYKIIDLGIRAGVFCLEKSLTQDVVWIGSDCQGVYTHIEGPYSMFSIKFANLDNKISHPVRSIFLDDEKSLWLGTKGDGVLKIDNFNESKMADSYSTTLYTTGNSALAHNSVFAFYKSRLPLLWIASENGISYYSYIDRHIHNVALSQPIRSAYGLYEDEKQQLWIATVGSGVFKARIAGGGAQVQLTDLKCYRTEDENSSNFFFTLHHGHDGRLYFGSRGSGAFYFDNGKLVSIPVKNDYGTRSVNDVFSVLLDRNTMWLGAGNGLLKKSEDGEQLFSGPENGFVNSTIHAMLKDSAGDLWISTNRGLVRFDPTTNHSQVFTSNYGVTVSEFSDGAAFATRGALFFGGIDGIVLVSKNDAYRTSAKFEPPLRPLSLSIAGQTANIFEHLKGSCHSPELSLNYDQNYFALTFVAPDFLDASNYSYYYSLDGKEWISNGSSNIISFAALDYGNYTLSVKYVNRCTDVESKPLAMKIHIAAPWYLSWWAKALYMLMAVAALLMAVAVYIKRQREKQAEAMERLKQANKDAVYEEKLRFFTNITHEFCTPLTLIYGPCERIMAYHGTDDYIGRYVGLIRSNVERLNSLIQELIDFRRMETGNKHLKITRMAVSDVCKDIMVSFSYIAEQNHIEFVCEITPRPLLEHRL